MKPFIAVLLLLVLSVSGLPAWAAPAIRFILVGDSTVSARSGWGPAFCQDVVPGVVCLDMARSGRSSRSYRADGSWAKVLEQLQHDSSFQATYVLIQFGHNDQPGKPGRSTDIHTEFPANIKRFVDEAKAAGAQPILVTPLSRRTFDRAGHIHSSLGPWADAMKTVARKENISCLPLHADSIAALNAMGPAAADTLAMAPPPPKSPSGAASRTAPPTDVAERNGEAILRFDHTHLGAKGAALFAHIVERELIAAVPALQPDFQPPVAIAPVVPSQPGL